MFYRHHAENCFGEHGASRERVAAALDRLKRPLADLQSRRDARATAVLDLPSNTGALAEIEALGTELQQNYRRVMIAGMGGAGVSGQTLAALKARHPLCFLDTVDPDAVEAALSCADIADTCFILISKSGTTVETLAHFHVFLERAKKAGEAGRRFIVVTSSGDSPLRRLAGIHGMRILDHDPDIGGRFSVLTKVGLLPAAVAGLDLRALLAGAQSVVRQMEKDSSPEQCLPALGAALQFALFEQGRNISVMMPYVQSLGAFSAWWRQCWAESLGKDGKGSTPVTAMGPADQHSQLQLYLDGPKDKLFTLIAAKRKGAGARINASADHALSYLHGRTLGDILAAEQKATLETLIASGCPVRLFELDALKEEQLGALLMHFTLEILFMAYLFDVDPFDQPAVEQGKQLAREYLAEGRR